MADLTLPGDIPGLLRRGSPVWIRHAMGRWPAVVEKDPAEHDREGGHWMIQFGTHFVGARSVFLDLSDPTGRAHAWAYLSDNCGTLWWGDAAEALGLDADLIDRAVHHAMRWVDMTPGEIDILRRVVLHVAGREVSDV